MTLISTYADSFNPKELKKNNNYPHYFLVTGNEILLQKETISAIQSFVVDGQEPYECEISELYTDADKYDLEDLLAQVNVIGMFSTAKFIKFIINSDKGPTTAQLKDFQKLIESNDTTNIYCFCFLNWKSSNKNSGFYKALNSVSSIHINCYTVSNERYPAWIKKRLKQVKLDYDDEAVEFLAVNFENNMFGCQQIIDQAKIRGLTKLTVDILNQTTDSFADYTINHFLLALIQGDVSKTFYILEYLYTTKNIKPFIIVAALRSEIIKLYNCREQNNINNSNLMNVLTSSLIPNDKDRVSLQIIKKQEPFDQVKMHAIAHKLANPSNNRISLYKLFIYITNIDIASKTMWNEEETIQNLKQFILEFINQRSLLPYDSTFADQLI